MRDAMKMINRIKEQPLIDQKSVKDKIKEKFVDLKNVSRDISRRRKTPRLLIELDMIFSWIVWGCNFKEYKWYKLYSIKLEERHLYLYQSDMDRLVQIYNPISNIKKNKEIINAFIGEYLRRDVLSLNNLPFEDFLHFMNGKDSIIYKPSQGSSGKGVQKYNIGMRDLKSLYLELMDKRPGIIEDVIVQHQNMNMLSPYSVNTIRIVTINMGGKCHIAYAAQRMGRCENTYVDNAGSGGIFAVVDHNTGQIVTDGVCENGDSFAEHPLTKTVIRNFQIPFWTEVLELIEEVYNKIPNINLVGWDIAISNIGPVIVEANITCPGAELLQLPYISSGIDCRKKLGGFFK